MVDVLLITNFCLSEAVSLGFSDWKEVDQCGLNYQFSYPEEVMIMQHEVTL